MRTGTWSPRRPLFAESTSPCRVDCPNGNPIPRAAQRAAQGDLDGALSAFLEETPLPGVCGRVCPHPCQGSCNRIGLDSAVEIRLLERAAADHGVAVPKVLTDRGADLPVAVLGSGPAGIAAAYHLARLGHPVTVMERDQRLGGLLWSGIPDYRLPRGILERELERISWLGVRFRTGVTARLSDLSRLQEEYRAVFVGTGSSDPAPIGLPGETVEGVVSALEFLKDPRRQSAARGARVAVIGGGNTAVDAARVALRRGARAVTIAYRRSREQMPAFAEEVREAEEEGVSFVFLAGPAAFLGRDGKVEAVRFAKTSRATERGQALAADEGEDFALSCDLVLLAAGSGSLLSAEKSDLAWERGRLSVRANGETIRPGVFAGGDLVPGLGSVVHALASGKRSAAAIHLSLTGDGGEGRLLAVELGPGPSFSLSSLVTPPPHWKPSQVVRLGEIDYLGRSSRQATVLERVDPAARVSGFAEVLVGPSAEDAQAEAFRCFFCGTCIGCDDCHRSCPELALLPPSTGRIGDLCADDYCKGCGTCAATCPRGILTMGEQEGVR